MHDFSERTADELIDEVYGEGFSKNFEGSEPFLQDARDHLFGQIWSRPGLSVRDRRLLALGVLAAFGRGDLFEVHAFGALASGDLTAEQLNESVLHLAYYAGSVNGTVIRRGVLAAIARHTAG